MSAQLTGSEMVPQTVASFEHFVAKHTSVNCSENLSFFVFEGLSKGATNNHVNNSSFVSFTLNL